MTHRVISRRAAAYGFHALQSRTRSSGDMIIGRVIRQRLASAELAQVVRLDRSTPSASAFTAQFPPTSRLEPVTNGGGNVAIFRR